MTVWQFMIVATFVFTGICVLYYCCNPSLATLRPVTNTNLVDRARRFRQRARRKPSQPIQQLEDAQPPIYTVAIFSTGGQNESIKHEQFCNINRQKIKCIDDDHQQPPSYAEAVQYEYLPAKSQAALPTTSTHHM